jgi:hypothetical protein
MESETLEVDAIFTGPLPGLASTSFEMIRPGLRHGIAEYFKAQTTGLLA